MTKAAIIGASGYTGAQLALWLALHPQIKVTALYVSANSQDQNKPLHHLHPLLTGRCELLLQPLGEEQLTAVATQHDMVFLATPHDVSHQWLPLLANQQAVVLDLSGAYRLPNANLYASYYAFAHQQPALLEQACYGLAEWHSEQLQSANVIAVPGCYPTASLLALLPVKNMLATGHLPVINAVSGVSGAGRKAALGNSFCEVSLQAYGVHNHRHQPEISHYLQQDIIFTPHLGQFKNGILATVTLKLQHDVDAQQVEQAFQQAYDQQPLVRLLPTWPKVDDVVNTPFADLHWQLDQNNQYLIVGCGIDNRLKGAATQAIQCANLCLGFESHIGLTRAQF